MSKSAFASCFLIPLAALLTGCQTPVPGDLEVMEESYIAPPFSPAAESDYLYPVPNRPGYYTEPQNYEGLVYSDLPPGSVVQSPYTGDIYKIPAVRGPRPE